MPSTRASAGITKPRIHAAISTEPEYKRKSTTRGRKGTGAGVTKRKAPAKHHKRKSHLSDKVEGVADKVVGTVTGRPGKKAAGTKKIRGDDGKGSRGRGGRKRI